VGDGLGKGRKRRPERTLRAPLQRFQVKESRRIRKNGQERRRSIRIVKCREARVISQTQKKRGSDTTAAGGRTGTIRRGGRRKSFSGLKRLGQIEDRAVFPGKRVGAESVFGGLKGSSSHSGE